nr:H500 [uncultured bacterium]
MAFLSDEQKALAQQIATLLIDRGEKVAVAEATAGGLISAALLWVPGASRYFAGGGVTYTLNSRVALAGVPAKTLENYQGTTPEMIATLAESMRQRLGTDWCISESGLAGPTGGRSGLPPGRVTIGVAGPVSRTEVFQTGLTDREANMIDFATRALRFLRDAIVEAKG